MPEQSNRDTFDSGRDWGHRIGLSIYVQADPGETQALAQRLSELVIGNLEDVPAVDFIGCSIEVEHDSPRDQGASGFR